MVGRRADGCGLHFQADSPGGATLWRQQRCTFRGRLEVFGPFGAGPRCELSYRCNDDLGLRVVLRLPFSIAQFIAPTRQLERRPALGLWSSPDFSQAEVACVCLVRRELLDYESGSKSAAPLALWRCLEIGGALVRLPEPATAGGRLQSALFASAYPQRVGVQQEVLVLAELGAPAGYCEHAAGGRPRGGEEGPIERRCCRVAVRSTSHLVSKAVAQALLDVICDPVLSAER